MPAPDIFLSYNREDQAAASRFAEGFEAAGLSVWWDVTLRSGEAYDTVTEEALRTAKAVVVLWSKRSVVSRWVRAEATLADRARTLVPARIEACDLPIMFELTQTADLAHWQGEAGDPAWRAFLGDVRRFVEAGAEPQHPEPPAPPPASGAPKLGRKPSIAVLPFINRSGVSDDDVFADGMVEDLTAALSLSRRLKVIAASATATYRHGARDLRQIGRDLGVRYLLEGNLRRVGSDLRVTAQLVEADDGDILWTQKFDRPLAEVAALQEELVTEVAAHLGVEVQRAEMEHALRKPGDITAWEAVLRAEANLTRYSPAGAQAAIAEAKRAIAIDPGYDAAYAVLAMARTLVWQQGGRADEAAEEEILDTIARARALDSGDPVVLARIGRALAWLGKDREALPFAQRAVAGNPNLDVPRLALAGILLGLGDPEGAIAEFDTMDRIAPGGIWSVAAYSMRSLAHFHAGRIAQALQIVEASLRLREYIPGHIHKAICLSELDRLDEARDTMRQLRNLNSALLFGRVEHEVRTFLYKGMAAERVDACVDIARQLWAETDGGG